MFAVPQVSLGATLSTDLISLIIEATTDIPTLDNWCSATKLSLELHRVALRTRWAHLRLDQTDLISAIGNDYEAGRGSNSIISKATQPFTLNNKPLYPTPASHIRRLFLNFQFREPEEGPLNEYGCRTYKYEQLPCDEDLQYSLSTLLQHCVSVQEIQHEGVLHQENLDELTMLHDAPLQCLRLRLRPPKFSCRWRELRAPYGILRNGRGSSLMYLDYDHCSLKWHNLASLQHLRRLELCNLWDGEGLSLASAVEMLPNLEVLLVATATRQPAEGVEDTSPSALNDFLSHVFPVGLLGSDSRCRLPIGLKSLTLVCSLSRYEAFCLILLHLPSIF